MLSSYPISGLLQAILEECALDRRAFVKSLGYRNVNKGIKRLDAWLRQGDGELGFLQRVASAYPWKAEAIADALRDSEFQRTRDKLARYREQFEPFILKVTKAERPTSITMAAVTGGTTKYIELGGRLCVEGVKMERPIKDLKVEQQLQFVGEIVRRHHERSQGICPFFGRITGYAFAASASHHVQFDVRGQIVATILKPIFRPPGVVVI